jgi:large conductance mechanosensitive channel
MLRGFRDFAGITVNGSKVVYGSTINALTYFAIVAAGVHLLVVVPMQKLAERRGVEEDSPAPSDETVVLTEIRDLLAAQQRT